MCIPENTLTGKEEVTLAPFRLSFDDAACTCALCLYSIVNVKLCPAVYVCPSNTALLATLPLASVLEGRVTVTVVTSVLITGVRANSFRSVPERLKKNSYSQHFKTYISVL